MEAIGVDVCYRPVRIGWCIRAGDKNAFRQAAQTSYALWGGRFNPILIVDREEEADRIVELFRLDMLLPIGNSQALGEFPKRFPHLPSLFYGPVFIGRSGEQKYAQLLDIRNALTHLRDTPRWNAIKEQAVWVCTWEPNDPLADVFLVQFGAYPPLDETGADYRGILVRAAAATECFIDPVLPIRQEIFEHLKIANLSRLGLRRHNSVSAGWDWPGFFFGDTANLDDLVCYWNLRASDIPLLFVDTNHINRYANIIPAWEKHLRETVANRPAWAIWSRRENIDDVRPLLGRHELKFCSLTSDSWNPRAVCPPMMHFGQVPTLGIVGRENGKPKISFALNDKPFCGDIWFHTQRVVVSISFSGRPFDDRQHTLHPPFIPEFNEFYGRAMHFEYDELRFDPPGRLRIEPGRLGMVIDATESDTFLYALRVRDLTETLFGKAGFSVELSRNAGLTVRQLIAQLGGLDGAEVFKIPGVRRLLKTYGPTESLTKRSALQLIGSKDPENPNTKFEDARGVKLDPRSVFSSLVEKGLYRLGKKLTCPNCRIPSWISLDAVKQQVVCELCGNPYDATRQLVNEEWHYRRSGVLGVERNANGAIAVALTLRQLTSNWTAAYGTMYAPGLRVVPKDNAELPSCEIDVVCLIPRAYPRKTAILLGECKDEGAIKFDQFEKHIDNLSRVADAFPPKRFKTFLLFAKLSPFTKEEIRCAKTLNEKYRSRVILLTNRELEPHLMYERTMLGSKRYAHSPEDMAAATVELYFNG